MVDLSFSNWISAVKPIFLIVLTFTIYSIFIFKFYRFTAKKDIFPLYLYRKNTVSHAGLRNFIKVLLYILEYIMLFPFVVFLWFVVLTVLFMLTSKIESMQVIFVLSIAMVSTIRIASYYNEDLAKDVAKLIPFALLAFFLMDMAEVFVNPRMFDIGRLIGFSASMPSLMTSLVYYLLFVIALELALRVAYLIFSPLMKYDKDFQTEPD